MRILIKIIYKLLLSKVIFTLIKIQMANVNKPYL